MCVVWYGRRKWTAIIKTDVPGISLKSIFFFSFYSFYSFSLFFIFLLKSHNGCTQFSFTLLPHPSSPLLSLSYSFPNARWENICIMYIMYCVWAQCNCSKMRHFFSKGQKHKTTEGWRPKVVSMETVFFLFNFIFYKNE